MKINDLLRSKGSKVFTTKPERTLKEAIRQLEFHNIGALVVVDDVDNIVGIISERDLIRYAASHESDFSIPVGRIMTTEVIVAMPQDDLNAVSFTMTEKRFRHLPVVEKGKLVGILSLGDIVKAQRDRYEGEVQTLEIQVIAAVEKG